MAYGPCMCGATDCPSCGPAQGYSMYDEDAYEEIVQQEIAELRASPVEVGDAMSSLDRDAVEALDKLVFEALDGETTTEFNKDQLAAIGQHLCDAVLAIFDERARS